MSNENHTKVVDIPYPGRDVAILSLFFMPIIPIIGIILAKYSMTETRQRGYSCIGIQKVSYRLNVFAVIFQILLVIMFIGIYKGVLSVHWLDQFMLTLH